MKNKFFVYAYGVFMIFFEIAVIIAVAVAGAVMYGLEIIENSQALIVFVIMIAAMLAAVLYSVFATPTLDTVVVSEEGIGYRRFGKEKLFIAFPDAVMTKNVLGLRGRRGIAALAVGVRGSVPAKPVFVMRGFATLADGWFVCAYNRKLYETLASQQVEEFTAETATDTGVIDGEGNRPINKDRAANRRKIDDTHDYNDNSNGGWRCD